MDKPFVCTERDQLRESIVQRRAREGEGRERKEGAERRERVAYI